MKKSNYTNLLFLLFLLTVYVAQAQVDPDIDCPAPDTFLVGDYQIADVNAAVGPGNGTSNFAPGIVTITGDANTRTFQNAILPLFNTQIETINLTLNCGIIQIEDVNPSLSCTGGIPYLLTTTDGANSTTYSLADDDASFIVNYIEDPQGSCGGPFNSSFSLTKNCSQPQNISFSNTTATSLNLNWLDTNDTANTTNTYTIEYGLQGFMLGTGQTETGISGNSATISSLLDNTAYDFYITGSCSSGDSSAALGPFSYTIINNPNPDFTIAPNGVTCLCPDADFGDIGTISINGELQTFTKRTETDLRNLAILDITDPQIALTCTSGIDDMSSMFSGFEGVSDGFNQNIESWDVSNVTDMFSMFVFQSSFNQPLNSWDVSNVTSMFQMFGVAAAFNQPLDAWNVGAVTNMGNMFIGAISFNQPINNWDVSNVTNMTAMLNGFGETASFDQPLDSWDVSNVENMSNMFGDSSFNQNINNWDVSNVENMSAMFSLSSAFNQPSNNWDVGNVLNMSSMFFENTNFNQDISSWDVNNVTFMDFMFNSASFNSDLSNWSFNQDVSLLGFLDNSAFSDANYDALLQSFNNQNLEDLTMGAENIAYCDVQTRTNLITNKGWTIVGDILGQCGATFNPSTTPFVTTWTVQNDLSVTIYTFDAFDYDFTIDWGDGQIDQNVNADITHTYANPGTYTVSISGVFPYFKTCEIATGTSICNNASKLSSVESWGNQEWRVMAGSFSRANNMIINATDAPNLAFTTSLKETFQGASSFNQPIDSWDVSNILTTEGMFEGASSFNQPLNNWDVSNVTTMANMFQNASSFDESLNSWNISNVTTMSFMFRGASAFNQPLSNWDVSQVTDMTAMFLDATSFNQFIETWDVSQVIAMSNMFASATSFNQPLNNWDVSNVTAMSSMFAGDFTNGSSFNQPLDNWDTSNVTRMAFMFSTATSFNQQLDTWDVSQVTDMSFMFRGATSFNEPLENWDVSQVASMGFMFSGAISFNQPLESWNVSQVIDMSSMFSNAISFNQDISEWCVEQILEEPVNFAINSALQSDFIPNWGAECENFSVDDATFSNFSVYPNPVQSQLFLSGSDAFGNEEVEISIYTIGGKVLSNEIYSKLPDHIDVSVLASGVYLLKLVSGNQSTLRRIIKK